MDNSGDRKIYDDYFWVRPLVFMISLIAGSWLILWLEQLKPSDFSYARNLFERRVVIPKSKSYPLRQISGELTATEVGYAKIAWRYFENNYQSATGFVNGVDMQPQISMRGLTSYLMGMVSAYEIGIIDKAELNFRMRSALNSLNKLPLVNNSLPNIRYHSGSLQMLDKNNMIISQGGEWSALEVARFFSFVNVVMRRYPEYLPLLKQAINRWNIREMVYNGFLYSGKYDKQQQIFVKEQEGTLGYEEYCSKVLIMAGYDLGEAMSYTDFIRFVDIYGTEIGVDTRMQEQNKTYNYLVNDPYILDGLEHGWDLNSIELAYRLYEVQKKRFINTGKLTAVSEDYVDRPVKYVCNAIYSGGREWTCLDLNGNNAEDLKFMSTKIAFGWYVLFDEIYANKLLEKVNNLNDPNRGWYAGIYENDGTPNKAITANTNGFILEALNYKMNGRIVSFE